jgi:hypothetical protein
MATNNLKSEPTISNDTLNGITSDHNCAANSSYLGMPHGWEYASDEPDEEYGEENFDISEANNVYEGDGQAGNFDDLEPSINFSGDNHHNEADLNDNDGGSSNFPFQTNGFSNGVKRPVSNGNTSHNTSAIQEESQKMLYERLTSNYKRLKENCDQFESDFNYEVSRMTLMQSRFGELKKQVDLQQELFEAYLKPKVVAPVVVTQTKKALCYTHTNPVVFLFSCSKHLSCVKLIMT